MKTGNDIEKVFGTVVRKLRLERDLSQEKLSELSGLDRSFVSEIERGEKTSSIRTLIKLANGLEVSTSDLMIQFEKSFKP